MKEGHRGTGGTSLGGGGRGGHRPRRAAIMGCVLRSDASWGLRCRRAEAVGTDTPGPGRGQRGPRPEPGDPAASYRVGGMELEDPPALAGGPSKKPWDAENVISPLGMPPVKQEAQSFLTIVMMGSWRCLS